MERWSVVSLRIVRKREKENQKIRTFLFYKLMRKNQIAQLNRK